MVFIVLFVFREKILKKINVRGNRKEVCVKEKNIKEKVVRLDILLLENEWEFYYFLVFKKFVFC